LQEKISSDRFYRNKNYLDRLEYPQISKIYYLYYSRRHVSVQRSCQA